MEVLVITHAESEGPGTFATSLAACGATVRIVRVHAGDRLPRGAGSCHAIVSMGGRMNAYEDGRYPFLRMEVAFLRRAIDAGTPIVGVCLGAQLLARACGGLVRRAPAPELGWHDVALTDAGGADPLLRGLSTRLRVFQWHDDAFSPPPGGKLLAVGQECYYQAFRFGCGVGLQFHIEVTRSMLREWLGHSDKCAHVISEFGRLEAELLTHVGGLCRNLVSAARAV